jgi:ribosome-binding factor A
MPRRQEQLAHALRDIVAQFISQIVEFEHGVLVTVTRAEVASDGRLATIFISAIPETYGASALHAITPHLYDLQGQVNASLGRRNSPRIQLTLDPASTVVNQQKTAS